MKKSKNSNLSQYSVLDSSIDVSRLGNYKVVSKVTRLHPDFENMSENIFSLIGKYIEKLYLAGIKLPQIIDSSFDQNKITFHCEYAGENIVEMVRSNHINNTLQNTNIFDQMFIILEKAQHAKLHFDPHPKNYVVLDGILSYVDFTPPWLEEYFNLRLSKAQGEEVKILQDFFGCMHFEELGFHLAGDLIKMDHDNYKNLPFLHQRLIERGLISKSYDEFITRAESIIEKEKRREKNNVFLL